MADLGLWSQGWAWVLSQKHLVAWAGCGRALVDRHWPAVARACASSSRLALEALRQWRGCAARGVLALASLGPAAVFVVLWSCFVCMTSPACALYALLALVRSTEVLAPTLLQFFSSDACWIRVYCLSDCKSCHVMLLLSDCGLHVRFHPSFTKV
jgi:hypothetical protein